MELVDFNANFSGFQNKEDILVDTGVLFALLNEYDSWHVTVNGLFNTHIINNPNALFLYINPCIHTELTSLATVERLVHKLDRFSSQQLDALQHGISIKIQELIDEEVLLVLDVHREALIKQLSTYTIFGSVDALNLSVANDYGINFLTVDNMLVQKAHENAMLFPNIGRIYHTHNRFQTTLSSSV